PAPTATLFPYTTLFRSAAETDLMAGKVAGPLHGVPWAPKDLYATKGIRTTGGSKILAESIPSEDATVVSRLSRAGAVVLGKLNRSEEHTSELQSRFDLV